MSDRSLQQSAPTFMPRPACVEIGPGIFGQGLIATEIISKGFSFGATHVYTNCPHIIAKQDGDRWVRLGIGAWYNQAATANQVNCRSIYHGNSPQDPEVGDWMELITLDVIYPKEELCVGAYRLYIPIAPVL